MTPRQKLYVRQKIEKPGISNYKAAIAAGYTPKTAENASRNIAEKAGVKEFMELLAPDTKIAEVLNDGLDATKQDQYTGSFLPDYTNRLNYAKEITTLKGYKTPDNQGVVTNINFNINRGE